MKLQEYRSKEILARHDIPLQAGETATTPEEARAAAERIDGPVVVKAQVLVGGRGKAGGVKLAATPDEAEARRATSSGMDIKGITVRTVLIAPAADIAKEYYLGLILDRAARAITIIASAEGGVEIEETAKTNPDAILRLLAASPARPPGPRRAAHGFFLGIPADLRKDFAQILRGLVRRLRRLRRRPGRDQSARASPRPASCSRSTRRSSWTTRRCSAIPSSSRCATSTKRTRRDRGPRRRHQLHQARRQHRLHGQRRRPGDDDHGPRQARRRRAGQLPRHRRRREGGQGRPRPSRSSSATRT